MPRNGPGARAGWIACSAAALWLGGAGACAADRAAPDPGAAGTGASAAAAAEGPQAARIAELERAIAKDRAQLRRLVSQEGNSGDASALHSNPELREIARRLPALQEELLQLRRARSGVAPAPAPR